MGKAKRADVADLDWLEHAINAFAAGRRASQQRAQAAQAARETRASEQPARAEFAEAPRASAPKKKSCCITSKRLKPT